MSGHWKEVARLQFKGDRFRDHALDLSALSELRQFQAMVAETAKALWRKANPDRTNLPPHFEDRTRLYLRRIEDGSATAPLEVFIEESEEPEFWEPEPTEVTEAVDLAYRVFDAVHGDSALPDEFPRELLPEYSRLGQALSDDEVLEFSPPGKSATPITSRERERLTALADPLYDDHVDVSGQVLEADVRQRKFQLWLNNRTSVQVSFTEEQEAQVTTALKDYRVMRLRLTGRGEFSPQGKLRHILTVDSLALVRGEEPVFDASAPAIEDVLARLAKEVPAEEWDRIPHDLTDRLDYYLYGVSNE